MEGCRHAPREGQAMRTTTKRVQTYELYPRDRHIGMYRQWRGSDITVVTVVAKSARQSRRLLLNDRVAAHKGDIGIVGFTPRDEMEQPGSAWPWR